LQVWSSKRRGTSRIGFSIVLEHRHGVSICVAI
jgi:hypothetical protein